MNFCKDKVWCFLYFNLFCPRFFTYPWLQWPSLTMSSKLIFLVWAFPLSFRLCIQLYSLKHFSFFFEKFKYIPNYRDNLINHPYLLCSFNSQLSIICFSYSSIPFSSSPSWLVYFKTNPRHHIISSVNTSESNSLLNIPIWLSKNSLSSTLSKLNAKSSLELAPFYYSPVQ